MMAPKAKTKSGRALQIAHNPAVSYVGNGHVVRRGGFAGAAERPPRAGRRIFSQSMLTLQVTYINYHRSWLRGDGKDPMTNPAHPDMAWHLRRLLEAVKAAACGLDGRWGWLAGPMLLLTW